MTNLQVFRSDKAGDSDWGRLCELSSRTTIFQKPEFINIISKIFGTGIDIHNLKSGENIRAGVVLFNKLKMGFRVTVHPSVIFYNSLLMAPFSSQKNTEQIFEANTRWTSVMEAIEKQYSYAVLVTFPGERLPLPIIWREWLVEPQYTAVIPLQDITHQWSVVDKDVRRVVRLGKKENLNFKTEGKPLELFGLLQQSYRRDNILPPLNRSTFLNFVQEAIGTGLGRIFTISTSNGKTLSAAFVLEDEPRVYGLFLGRNTTVQPNIGTVNLLWKICEHYASRGFSHFDLGGLQRESIARFKLKFGAEIMPHFKIHYFKNRRIRFLFDIKSRLNLLLRKSF